MTERERNLLLDELARIYVQAALDELMPQQSEHEPAPDDQAGDALNDLQANHALPNDPAEKDQKR